MRTMVALLAAVSVSSAYLLRCSDDHAAVSKRNVIELREKTTDCFRRVLAIVILFSGSRSARGGRRIYFWVGSTW